MESREITAEERQALRAQVLTHLSGIDDLRLACEIEDFASAERLGTEIGDELRLMQDLGWEPRSPTSEAITLTMSPEQLHRVFDRLRADVEELDANEKHEEQEEANLSRPFRERARYIREVSERVLGSLNSDSDHIEIVDGDGGECRSEL